MPVLDLDDDGFITTKIGEYECEVDAYDVHSRMLEFQLAVRDEFPDGPDLSRARAFNARVSEMLKELGFGPVSHRAADKFAVALFDAVAALGKLDAGAEAVPTPASPTTTAPTP